MKTFNNKFPLIFRIIISITLIIKTNNWTFQTYKKLIFTKKTEG